MVLDGFSPSFANLLPESARQPRGDNPRKTEGFGLSWALLTPDRLADPLLYATDVLHPGVLDIHRTCLKEVLADQVFPLVPDLKRPVIPFHEVVHIYVVQLRDRRRTRKSTQILCS